MEFAHYSIALIIAFALARYVTENTQFHLKSKKFWLHHWIIATLAMFVALYLELAEPVIWGVLTGVALEGLPRKNWSIRRKQ